MAFLVPPNYKPHGIYRTSLRLGGDTNDEVWSVPMQVLDKGNHFAVRYPFVSRNPDAFDCHVRHDFRNFRANTSLLEGVIVEPDFSGAK